MSELCYKIKYIPDLTLGKYNYLSENGVDGVLKLHNSFLWQWHEKSRLCDLSIHLIYVYKSDCKQGEKIKCFFVAKGKSKDLDNVNMLLNGSYLSEYFHFELVYERNDDGEIFNKSIDENDFLDAKKVLDESHYNCCCMLTKEEVFFTGSDSKLYYNVPKWKVNDSGRLYEMFRMMESLNEECVFRVDLKAVKKNRSLRKTLTSGPIPSLHALQTNMRGERDYGADTVLHSYDELMKELDSCPHFQANVFTFSNGKENGALIMSAAVSEAINEGDYHISRFVNSFNARTFLDGEELTLIDSDDTTTYTLDCDAKGVRIISTELDNSNSKALRYLNTLFTLDEISPLFRFPCLYDGETINLRKETVAPHISKDDSLFLGYDENGYEINFPLKLLPKHAFVSGVPGSGKTNTMHHLTHSLWAKHQIPFLVLEPAKKEYRALCNLEEMKDLRLFSPGSNMVFPLHINPFEFAKGLSVAEHIRSLCEVFEGAFPLDNPMPFLLDTAIEGVYRDNGWRPEDVYENEEQLKKKPFPTMSMLYKRLEEELAQTTYSSEVRGNLESALKVRIGSLLRREMGDVFDVAKSSLSPEEWLENPCVVELESMGNGPANFLTLMLCTLIRECLKVNPIFECDDARRFARHVIFIEEAHNLIGPDSEAKTGEGANAKTAATAFIVKMLAEVRALKESVFIADQLPTAMAQEVIKNTGLKIALRLTAMDDRQLLCNSMSANSSQIEDMGNFEVGEALLSYEKLQRPFKMRINEWCGNIENPLKTEYVTPKNDAYLLEKLKNNKVYIDNVNRSAQAIARKFSDRYKLLTKRIGDIEKDFNEFKNIKIELDRCTDELLEYSNIMADIVSQYNNDADLALKISEEYKQQFSICGDLMKQIKLLEDDLNHHKEKCISGLKIINDMCRYIEDLNYVIKHFISIGAGPDKNERELIKNGKDNKVRVSALITSLLRTHFQQDTFDLACSLHNLSKLVTLEDSDVEDKLYNDLAKFAAKYKLKTACLKK